MFHWFTAMYLRTFKALLLFGLLISTARQAAACPDIGGLADLNCDGRVEIICFGDSITFGIGDSQKLGYPGRLVQLRPGLFIRNLGDPGERTANGKGRASRRFTQYQTGDYAIILEGVNDYFQTDRTSSNTRDNLLAMVRSASATGAVTMLANLTDVRRDFQKPWVRAVNTRINPHRKIDFFSLGTSIISSDLLHPNGNGYQQMALRVSTVLQQMSDQHRPIDSDADGIYDFAEPRYGSNPNIADSDGDGILDGAEIFTYGSSPLLLDSDSDGYSDNFEVLTLHSNPADPKPGAPLLSELKAISAAVP